MGEIHPADRKVVVEFCPKDLKDLTEAQQLKLMKLAGPRYNPGKDIVRMSCERFEHQAQNKRYLGDLINKMITMAKVGSTWDLAVVKRTQADRSRTQPIHSRTSLSILAIIKPRKSPSFPRSGA